VQVTFLMSVVPHYKREVWTTIIDRLKCDVQLFAGEEFFDPTVKTSAGSSPHVRLIENYYFLGRRFLFQTGMWRPTLRADAVVLELNPRIISGWLLIVVRKLLGKRTLLYGHAWPRRGKNETSDRIRNLLRRLGDAIIVYTESEATELREKMPNKRIIAAPNALYSKRVMGADPDPYKAKNLICVGRLVPHKKPMLLLEAFASVIDRLPTDCALIFAGVGPLRTDLEARRRELGLERRVAFKGHVPDYDLRELYAESIASVSPGYVGLSITQSFSFGVPMIIARDEPHAPEIEAAAEGVNSLMFASDSRSSLSEAILTLVRERDSWIKRRAAIAAYCADHYSLEAMADRFAQVLLGEQREDFDP
jgi:glycosyltransferase involved in cell wall biosynthesis